MGMTLVYALSGVAVNHRRDWDYNQSTTTEQVRLEPAAHLLRDLPADRRELIARDAGAVSPEEEKRLVAAVSSALGRSQPPRNAFWTGPDRMSLFFGPGDDDTVEYSPRTGGAVHTVRQDRFLFRQLNFLHLNEGGGPWTWAADLYAVALAFLGLTGVVMVKGRAGLAGRGGILLAAGVLVPLAGWLALGK